MFNYKDYIVSGIKTEFYSKYKRSKMGMAWIVLHPMMQVLIYTLVLSVILRAKIPGIDGQYTYAVYLIAGIVGWNLFSEIVSRLLTVFIDNGNLLKKVKFPRGVLPSIVVGTASVNFFVMLASMFVVFLFFGHMPTKGLGWMPVVIFITLLNAVGFGMLFGVLNVFFRDVGQIVTIALQFWFWLTPIVYSIDMIPESYRGVFFLNPMAGVISAYQDILARGVAPDVDLLIYPLGIGLLFVGFSIIVYQKAGREMSDVL